jgi:predicted dehydrogenase
MSTIRIGIVGLGANTRLRHVPGLRACNDVEIVGVVNRTPESTSAAARDLSIPRTFDTWQQLVADERIDAVMIGTWPYLHCDITLAALDAGKHVLTEARMARNAAEAHKMLAASRRHPQLVAQIVPSPFGLRAGPFLSRLLTDGFLGQLREAAVLGTNDQFAEADVPFHWRQSAELSGLNMLTLGILHETLIRFVPDPIRVRAQTSIFTRARPDPASGEPRTVETPDSVHVLTELPEGARGIYHLSAAIRGGPSPQIHLYGSEGTLRYEFAPEDRLLACRRDRPALHELRIPASRSGAWRVEADFIDSIREGKPVELTDFATGVRYMEFTEAVARSAQSGAAVDLPLAE